MNLLSPTPSGHNRGRLTLAIAVYGAIFLNGCATARLNQFRGFAQAGVAYTKASQTLTDQAGAASISADSAILIKSRPDVPSADDRRQAVTENDRLLKERLVILHQLSAHAQILQNYFQIIADMVDSHAGNDLSTAAQGTLKSIQPFSKSLREGKIGNAKIADFLPDAIQIAVANIKVRALNSELHERAPLIEHELALQEAALTALSKDLQQNLTIKLNLDETQGIIGPYASQDRLPADWINLRQQVLTTSVAVQSASDAARAAKALRESFARLVAGSLSEAAISSLIQDINSILDLAGKIRGTHT